MRAFGSIFALIQNNSENDESFESRRGKGCCHIRLDKMVCPKTFDALNLSEHNPGRFIGRQVQEFDRFQISKHVHLLKTLTQIRRRDQRSKTLRIVMPAHDPC